jgi:hypothetical protein
MKTRISMVALLSLLTVPSVLRAEDWAYELSDRAKGIYMEKIAQVPCSKIDELIQSKSKRIIYIAIRDAGLFYDNSCLSMVQKHRTTLEKMEGVRDAVAFYLYRMGDKKQLDVLAKSFDRDARKTGDHWTVEIFGFIDDWNIAGRRLVRHSAYSDGAGSELLCSALMWRRYLYGEADFENNWFKIGRQEKVDDENLKDRYRFCYPSMPRH